LQQEIYSKHVKPRSSMDPKTKRGLVFNSVLYTVLIIFIDIYTHDPASENAFRALPIPIKILPAIIMGFMIYFFLRWRENNRRTPKSNLIKPYKFTPSLEKKEIPDDKQ
jgi:hypothetical protein